MLPTLMTWKEPLEEWGGRRREESAAERQVEEGFGAAGGGIKPEVGQLVPAEEEEAVAQASAAGLHLDEGMGHVSLVEGFVSQFWMERICA